MDNGEKIPKLCPFSFSPMINPNKFTNEIAISPWGIPCLEKQCNLWLENECAINILAKNFMKVPQNVNV